MQTPTLRLFVPATAIAGCLLLFAGLAWAVSTGSTTAFDRALLLALRNARDLEEPVGPWWVKVMLTDLTSLGSITVLIAASLAAIGYVLFHRQWHAAVLLALSLASGQALSALLKLAVEQPRPDVVPGFVDVYTLSFPSGHAMLSAVTYLTMAALAARVERRRLVRIYFVSTAAVLTFLIGFSRVYLGVHWPTDVLGGWIIGAAWALLCWTLMAWLQRRGQVEKPA